MNAIFRPGIVFSQVWYMCLMAVAWPALSWQSLYDTWIVAWRYDNCYFIWSVECMFVGMHVQTSSNHMQSEQSVNSTQDIILHMKYFSIKNTTIAQFYSG